MGSPILRWGYDLVWDKWPVMLVPLVRKFRAKNGYWPDVLRPRTFNERILHRMLFDRRPLLTTLAGKFESRAYVRDRLGNEDALPALLGVVRVPSEIRAMALPERFIMKGNHGSNMRYLHQDGAPDLDRMEALCRAWIGNDFGKYGREWVYKGVERAVVVEELLPTAEGAVPRDVKLHCFGGEPLIVDVISGRFVDQRRDVFRPDWTPIPCYIDAPMSDVPPAAPVQLDRMFAMARALSLGLDYLRVDLYDTGAAPFVGELTTTPDAGTVPFPTRAMDAEWGALWPTLLAPRSGSG